MGDPPVAVTMHSLLMSWPLADRTRVQVYDRQHCRRRDLAFFLHPQLPPKQESVHHRRSLEQESCPRRYRHKQESCLHWLPKRESCHLNQPIRGSCRLHPSLVRGYDLQPQRHTDWASCLHRHIRPRFYQLESTQVHITTHSIRVWCLAESRGRRLSTGISRRGSALQVVSRCSRRI